MSTQPPEAPLSRVPRQLFLSKTCCECNAYHPTSGEHECDSSQEVPHPEIGMCLAAPPWYAPGADPRAIHERYPIVSAYTPACRLFEEWFGVDTPEETAFLLRTQEAAPGVTCLQCGRTGIQDYNDPDTRCPRCGTLLGQTSDYTAGAQQDVPEGCFFCRSPQMLHASDMVRKDDTEAWREIPAHLCGITNIRNFQVARLLTNQE